MREKARSRTTASLEWCAHTWVSSAVFAASSLVSKSWTALASGSYADTRGEADHNSLRHTHGLSLSLSSLLFSL